LKPNDFSDTISKGFILSLSRGASNRVLLAEFPRNQRLTKKDKIATRRLAIINTTSPICICKAM
jgi:hypothetical protein